MRKILFPTDLTDNSVKALNYAQNIAINSGLELLLLHSSMTAENKLLAEKKLNKLTLDLASLDVKGADRITYEGVCVEGLPVEQVANWMSKDDTEMLVMATSGDHRDHFQGIYLKSNTASVLERIQKPILFFPLHSKVETISNVLVSIDVMKYSIELLEELEDFVKQFNAKIQFIYVCNSESVQIKEAIIGFNASVSAYFSDVQIKVIMNEVYEESIANVVEQEKIDLLVMIKYKKQFWEKWLTKSNTQQMTYSSAIPVLVLSAE